MAAPSAVSSAAADAATTAPASKPPPELAVVVKAHVEAVRFPPAPPLPLFFRASFAPLPAEDANRLRRVQCVARRELRAAVEVPPLAPPDRMTK